MSASYNPSADRTLLGIALMVAFCVTAPLIDVASKLATQTIPVGQITLARFLVQGALMAPVCLALGHGLRLPPGTLRPLIWRAVFLILSTYTFVGAVRFMPLADALAIAFVEPFVILLIARFWLKEPVGPRRLVAVVVGFAGAMLVIQPSFARFGLVALLPLCTAVTFALYMLSTRALSRRMDPVPMQFHTSVVAAVICLPILLATNALNIPTLTIVQPTGLAWVWLAGVGAASAVAHLFMSYALKFAPSQVLAPIHYSEIVMAVTFGWAVFGDLPNALSFTGIAIIVASGLYVFHRERLAERRMRAEAE
jgi:drug/metabolite transporter (DMT)-like permease